jgi:UDP-glucose 4-epimerase
MTRFLMSLEDSVNLVLYAFENAEQGDIFVQKAPASTVGDLVVAIQELFNKPNSEVRTIGTRHGEKLYESLVSREEMAKADDLGAYYRIPADNRDLNYAQYFSEGEDTISSAEDYTSHNAQQLNVAGIKELLLKLDFIQEELHA